MEAAFYLKLLNGFVNLLKKYSWQTLLALLVISVIGNSFLYFALKAEKQVVEKSEITNLTVGNVTYLFLHNEIIPIVKSLDKLDISDPEDFKAYAIRLSNIKSFMQSMDSTVVEFGLDKKIVLSDSLKLNNSFLNLKSKIFK